MGVIKQLERIKYIDYLITTKQACCRMALSKKLNLTTRQLNNTINLMKELGAPIEYNKRTKSYYYKENISFWYGYR